MTNWTVADLYAAPTFRASDVAFRDAFRATTGEKDAPVSEVLGRRVGYGVARKLLTERIGAADAAVAPGMGEVAAHNRETMFWRAVECAARISDWDRTLFPDPAHQGECAIYDHVRTQAPYRLLTLGVTGPPPAPDFVGWGRVSPYDLSTLPEPDTDMLAHLIGIAAKGTPLREVLFSAAAELGILGGYPDARIHRLCAYVAAASLIGVDDHHAYMQRADIVGVGTCTVFWHGFEPLPAGDDGARWPDCYITNGAEVRG